ncbi:hypothetical protein BXY66_2736 [Shimia isoporae]|uniref:Uncharacterized protein n=1 Tax=Shimia isoporae TaxID=647720 RepID=A0A4V2Q272_9RHOB|nr:hypothetical protein BXY66_2736 [Shimia isoporae]
MMDGSLWSDVQAASRVHLASSRDGLADFKIQRPGRNSDRANRRRNGVAGHVVRRPVQSQLASPITANRRVG